jgi:flagellar hook-basal body complex protein FliE
MSLPPVNSIGATSNMAGTNSSLAAKKSSGSGSNAFSELIQGANQQHLESEKLLENLVAGGEAGMHEVVVSAAKADLSFRLVLEMRNKLTDAYQEIMRMQV